MGSRSPQIAVVTPRRTAGRKRRQRPYLGITFINPPENVVLRKMTWNEETYVEIPFCEQLARLGWEVRHLPAGAEPGESQRLSFREVIIEPELREALRGINPFLEDDQITEVITRLDAIPQTPLIEANITATDLLLNNTTVHENRIDGTPSPTVRYIDFDHPEKNRFLAVRQFKVAVPGTTKHIIPDIVLFVNGIPLIVIECKSPAIPEPIQEAVTQLRRYSNSRDTELPEGSNRLFTYNLCMIATSRETAKVSTIGGQEEHYLEWKDPYPTPFSAINPDGQPPDSQQRLIHGMLAPARLLEILRNFTVFRENDQGKKIKIVARYQQYRAVQKILARLRSDQDPREKGGVVWHTQGSGKSLTMVFLIRAMRKDPILKKYKVVLITDRTDLERQLEETAATADEQVYTAGNIAELKTLLQTDTSNVVMGMMQKFQEKGKKRVRKFSILNRSDKILLLIDEAHRTQASVLGANVEQALPNCTRIAFTGTPIMKPKAVRGGQRRRRTTTGIFGEYIDKYTIRESIEDGSTLQIIYEGRTSRDAVKDGRALDDLFEDMFKDHTEEEKEAIRKKYGTYRRVLEAPRRIEKIAADIIDHYRTNILPNGFKAQVVVSSRLAAVRYKEALDRALADAIADLEAKACGQDDPEDLETLRRIKTDVIISGSQNDEEIYKPYTNPQKHEAQIARFKKPLDADDPEKQDGLAILVVVDMLITGFDAPIEQVMYIDKRLVEHSLLQAIARVNRPASGKNCGYVVDYYGIGHHLKEALGVFADEDVEGAFDPLGDEIPKMREAYTRLLQFFAAADLNAVPESAAESSSYAGRTLDPLGNEYAINECVEYLADEEKRAEFLVLYKSFARKVDMILPDRRALDYVHPVKVIGFINTLAERRYRDRTLNLAGCGEKVRALIDDYVFSQGIDPKVPPVSITSENFEKSLSNHRSSKAKASEMAHAIRYHISQRYDYDPEFYQTLSERLNDLLTAHEEDWDTLVKELRKFLEEVREGRQDVEHGLDPVIEMPFYDILVKEVYGSKDLSETEREIAAGTTKDIVFMIQREIRKVDFWKKATEKQLLRRYIKEILLESRLPEILQKRNAITDRFIGLAEHLDAEFKHRVIL